MKRCTGYYQVLNPKKFFDTTGYSVGDVVVGYEDSKEDWAVIPSRGNAGWHDSNYGPGLWQSVSLKYLRKLDNTPLLEKNQANTTTSILERLRRIEEVLGL